MTEGGGRSRSVPPRLARLLRASRDQDERERLSVTLGPAAQERLLRARPCGRSAPPDTRRRFPPCSTG